MEGQINLAAGTPSVSLGVTRGFVGLLDVLGFSNLVSGDAAGTRLHQYVTSLQEALTVPGPGPAVRKAAMTTGAQCESRAGADGRGRVRQGAIRHTRNQ